MAKKVKNHEADISNKNNGTSGKNITRKKNEDNTENQKNIRVKPKK